jgi:delta 1-pyrroline-5-carboxylate dehydrogenase
MKALEKGLILLTCGVYGNVIRFLAPITIQDNVFNEALDIIEDLHPRMRKGLKSNDCQSLLSRLKDQSLATDKALVAGKWLDKSDSGKTFEVTNPSTGDVIAVLPDMGRDETSRAIDAAYKAQKAWAKKTGKERAAFCASFSTLWSPMPTILRRS